MIDKELAQSGEMTSGIVDSRLEVAIRQARKMDTWIDRKLIMINPIEELDATGEEAAASALTPKPRYWTV